jgi:hypothetical protein
MSLLLFYKTKAAAARANGVSGEAFRKWVRDGVPAERVLDAAEKTGWVVTPHQIRPDIYPNVQDGLPIGFAAGRTAIPLQPIGDENGPFICIVPPVATGSPEKRSNERRSPEKPDPDYYQRQGGDRRGKS